MTDLLVVVGARPNFMKAAPIVLAAARSGMSFSLVHTGQHYDAALSRVFFHDLGLPEPHVQLGVGSGSHAKQTARIMVAFESALLRIDPAIVVVVGDVNSTLACALVAAKEHYPVAHVEAGLRSFDERMPEEVNRRLCDHLSRWLYTTSVDGNENLRREGIPDERVAFVGNTMIDTLLRFVDVARDRRVPERLLVGGRPYAVVDLPFKGKRAGKLPLQLIEHVLESFARAGGVTLNIRGRGRNDHHLAEAAFKALGRALGDACAVDARRSGPASTKGTLG